MLASEVRKGSAEVLILGALETRARHGYEIARLIATRTDGEIALNTATLYPTLHRLEQKKLIVGRWVEQAGARRRRFYRLTPAGRTALREQRRSWQTFLTALTRAAGIGEA